jgi:hypothetical protein
MVMVFPIQQLTSAAAVEAAFAQFDFLAAK